MRMILRVMCAMARRYRRVVTTSGRTVKQRLVANKHSTVISVVVLVVVLVLVVCLLSSIMSKPTTTVRFVANAAIPTIRYSNLRSSIIVKPMSHVKRNVAYLD
jgi:hypothetical protein